MAIAEDTNDVEYGHADDFPGTADADSKTIEVDIDHVEVSERARGYRTKSTSGLESVVRPWQWWQSDRLSLRRCRVDRCHVNLLRIRTSIRRSRLGSARDEASHD